MILNNGFCLHPNFSLTRNIGADGSGEHMSEREIALHTQPISRDEIITFPNEIVENIRARKRIASYYRNLQPRASLVNRVKHRIKDIFGL